jgi:two-component system response regulator YesN
MWKVIIVEDEEEARTFLRKHVDWESKGFVVVGDAGNGRKALDLIRVHRPHLVICDIFMPIMDGIQLLQQSREEGFDSLFIMLTCADEFEYAQQAIQHGAFNYLLKLSLSVEDLYVSLNKINEELLKRVRIESNRLLSEWQPVYEAVWNRIQSSDSLGEAGAELGRRAKSAGFSSILVCSVILSQNPNKLVDSRSLFEHQPIGADRSKMIHTFALSGVTTYFIWSRSEYIVNPIPNKKTGMIAIYACTTGLDHWSELWIRTWMTLTDCWYDEITGWREAKELNTSRNSLSFDSAFFSWEQEKEWTSMIEGEHWDQCEAYIDYMWKTMRHLRAPLIQVKQLALRMDQIMLRVLRRPSSPAFDESRSLNHNELKSLLTERLIGLIRVPTPVYELTTDHKEINLILQYIHHHYDQPITLATLAVLVSLEEHYVSALFKRKIKENVIGYINRYRIRQACYLLESTDLSVQSIGLKVGFANGHYFNRLFKKITGSSPGEYRRSQGK